MNTLERYLLTLAAAAALAVPANAQTAEYRATFTGGSSNDSGKCTIEVYVDGSADVEIRGDRGFLRTVSGQPAQWRRFVCSGPMPSNPSDFRFIGIDGRGRQELIQDPRNGHGAAVVRVQDPNGGGEGYTFDLVWRGAGFGPNPSGQPLDGRDHGALPNDEVRGGENTQGRHAATADRYEGHDDATFACQRAVEQRIQHDGYRSVQFGRFNADSRRRDWIAGTATGQRGNNGRSYAFDIGCSVDLDNGNIRSVQVNRR